MVAGTASPGEGRGPRVPSVFISGYYGVPNFGDELILRSLISMIAAVGGGTDSSVGVKTPGVCGPYSGISVDEVAGFFPSAQYFRGLPRRLRRIRGSALTILGGGGLLGDYYGALSPLRYCVDALAATATGRPFVLLGVGAAGVSNPFGRLVASTTIRWAGVVVVRDDSSRSVVETMSGRGDVLVAPDLGHIAARELAVGSPSDSATGFRDLAIVNLRQNPPTDLDRCMRLVNDVASHFHRIVMLGVESGDDIYLRAIVNRMPEILRSKCQVVVPTSLEAATRLLASSAIVIAERLHVNLMAAHLSRPLFSVAYEDKVSGVLDAVGADDRLRTDLSLEFAHVSWANLSSTADRSRVEQLTADAQAFYSTALRQAFALPRPSAARRVLASMLWLTATCYAIIYRAGRLGRRLFRPSALPLRH